MVNAPTLDEMAFFDLGCQVTKHLHGIRGKAELTALLQVVKDLADGRMTLVDTPEEVIAQLEDRTKALAPHVPEVLREMRAQEQAAAQRIWDRIIEMTGGGK